MKLLADFFPVLLFFVAYKLYDIYVATSVAILASLIQVGAHWYQHRRVERMHLVTLGLLVVFGGMTLLLQDRVFIMWKPSIVNWLFAAVFLASQFIGAQPLVQRMMGHAVAAPDALWRRLNWAWVLFFLFMGGANLYVANQFFTAEALLVASSGLDAVDLTRCAEQFQGATLDLCQRAQGLEDFWVNFKLFGMLGLTLVFVLGQALFLARHVKDPDPAT